MRLPNSSVSLTGVPLSVDFLQPEDYFVFIFQLLFATTTVLVAGSVVISILATKALLLQNRFIFMLNTSVCDTLVGLSVYYLGLFDVYEGFPPRNGTYSVLNSLMGINILTFMFAQFDRYFAVCHPFMYNRFITRHVVIAVNVYCWIYTYGHLIIRIFLPLSTALQFYIFSNVIFLIIILVKVIMTVKLYFVVRFQVERDPPGPERDSNRESLQIIIFVVLLFLVLWSPSFVNILLRYFTDGVTFRNEATNIFAIMARFNSLCTPSVYIWGSPALRQVLVHAVWGRVCPRCNRRYSNSNSKE
ncbi:uncharacterized protein [Eucyclogobius newberryi]|uniref:uncharacterized protein n=1 Tax=Eucyclogobius newberryi TaxID=166745 RepID=UPI003B5C7248